MQNEKTVSAAEMKALEQAAAKAGLSELQMMENAGYQAFLQIVARWPKARTAAVFAGKGNNGGDGFVVARLLSEAGLRVWVILCEGVPVTEGAVRNLERLTGVEIWGLEELENIQETRILKADVVVDGLYGTGFHGNLRPNGLRAAEMMNRAAGGVCALDLPSGVNADTGEVAEGAVHADVTVAFHALKNGQLVPAAAACCGTLVVADIGISQAITG